MKVTLPAEPPEANQAETRRQLLEAAGEVFAEVGFRDATVREICRRANANIAAVNYHFGDKETLYAEVMRYAQQKSLEKHPPLLAVSPNAVPEKKLHAFVESLLRRIFDNGPTAWYGKLMSREMIEPTAALDSLVAEKIRPMSEQIQSIVAEILGSHADEDRVRQCSWSVMSQCVFYKHCGALLTRLFPEQRFDASAIKQLADHITEFSLAAMKNLPAAKKTGVRH